MYLVTAYRWGWLNGHQYQVYCGADRIKAIALARNEQNYRGGKYGCAVYEWNADGTECKCINYFGAIMHQEEAPFHNWRLDYFEKLGHVLDSYGSGKMLLPDPQQPGRLKYIDVEKPPQYVLDEIARAQKFCDVMLKAQAERSAASATGKQ